MKQKLKTILASEWFSSPRLEIVIMVASILLAFFGLAILGAIPESLQTGEMSTASVAWIQFGFFILSVAIAFISVIAGIGGGVIFTPLMLAFTGINSVIVRGTGLVVAMFSGLISTGIFIKKGLGNYRLTLILTLSQAIGALSGATLAITTAQNSGKLGEGLMRTGLGIILIAIAVYFIIGGKKLEFPVIGKVDKFTKSLGLEGYYFEESEKRIRFYQTKQAALGIALIFIVGLIGGFFGMGGGWAITPVLNMAMGLPMKLAAANSGIILGVGSCVSIWPYIFAGGLIPLFVLPWLSGQVIGGFVGSYVLSKIRVSTIRYILIGIMIFTSITLISKGLSIIGVTKQNIPNFIQVALFLAIMVGVIFTVIHENDKGEKNLALQEGNNKGHKAISKMGTDSPDDTRCSVAESAKAYATMVHWITIISAIAALFIPILILINPSNNVLNPNTIFGAIFSGASPAEIWSMAATGSFPGAHFYLTMIGRADSWAQLAINLGCSVALWALIPAIALQLFKEKNRLDGFLGTAFLILIALSVTGLLSVS